MSIGCWPDSKPFPAVLRDKELREVLGMCREKFAGLKKAGAFTSFEQVPQVDTKTTYSGALVKRWVEGNNVGSARQSFRRAS